MKNFLYAFFLLCLFQPVLADKILSIQTLNVYKPIYSGDQSRRKSSLLDFIKKYPSDIHFFQELWFEEDYKKLEKAFESIGMKSIFLDGYNRAGKWSGLAVSLNGTAYKVETHSFPPSSFYGKISRVFNINKGFGAAYIRHSDLSDYPFWIINVHMDNLSQYARLKQLIHYFKWFLKNKIFESPVISSGDFNFKPDSLEFEIMLNLFRFNEPQSYLGLSYRCTLCEENSDFLGYYLSKLFFMDYEKTVDYIFFKSSPNLELVPQVFNVFPKKHNGVALSDHYGVKSDIVFKKRFSVDSLDEEALNKKITAFSQTLNQIESQLSGWDFSEREFLKSLRDQLEEPDSLLIQHFKKN